MKEENHVLPEECGYRIVRQIGRGGGGTVYLVRHLSTGQIRAAKVIADIQSNGKYEWNMMKALEHPSLPRVLDVMELENQLWIFMEYLRGRTLDQIPRREMTVEQIFRIAVQLADVLCYLHTRREPVLHLDIKPTNLLLGRNDRLVLLDFGAAVRGQFDPARYQAAGTPGFAAPEQQMKGKQIDARADIYGFGAVLYYCCHGHAPEAEGRLFQGGREYHGLERISRRCIAGDPDMRFPDSRSLSEEVKREYRRLHRQMEWRQARGAVVIFAAFLVFLLSVWTGGSRETAGSTDGTAEQLAFDVQAGVGLPDEELMEAVTAVSSSESSAHEDIPPEKEYEKLLEQAEAVGLDQAAQCYAQAADLRPWDAAWYQRLLSRILSDSLFDLQEEMVWRELLFDAGPEGRTRAEAMKELPDIYGPAAYETGLAYWYFYEGAGGKTAAAWWFSQAAETQQNVSEPAEWARDAELYTCISSYYGMLGRTGDEQARAEKEQEYWEDLQLLWSSHRTRQDTEVCRKLAEEFLQLVIMKAHQLRNYGVTEDDIAWLLQDIRVFLDEAEVYGTIPNGTQLEELFADAQEAAGRIMAEGKVMTEQ